MSLLRSMSLTCARKGEERGEDWSPDHALLISHTLSPLRLPLSGVSNVQSISRDEREKKGKRAVEETTNLRQISHKRNSDSHVRHVLFLDFYSVIIHGGTVAGWRKMTRIAMQK